MPNAAPSDRSSIQEFRRALIAGRRAVVGCLAGGLLAGLAINAWTTPVYRAVARLEIRRAIDAAPTGVGGFQSENLGLYTTAELITSRRLLAGIDADFAQRDWLDPGVWAAPLRLGARALASATAAGFGGPTHASPLPSRAPRATADERLDWLGTIVHVEPVQDTRLVDIKVDHPVPEAARGIAERLAERFVTYAAVRAGAALPAGPGAEDEPGAPEGPGDARPAASRGASEDSLSARAAIRQLDARIANLTDELVRAEADEAVARDRSWRFARWTRDSLDADGGLPLESTGLGALRQQLVAARMRIASARQVYGPQHPRMRALESELAVVRAGVDRELARVAAEARAEEDALATRVASLRADLGRAQTALAGCERRLPSVSGSVAAPAEAPVEIVDHATVLPRAIRPRPLLNLAACLSAGGLIGCGLATARHAGRPTIRGPEDAERELGLPLLGVLPRPD